MIYEDGDAITETLMTSTSTRRFVSTVNLSWEPLSPGVFARKYWCGGWQFTIGEAIKEL